MSRLSKHSSVSTNNRRGVELFLQRGRRRSMTSGRRLSLESLENRQMLSASGVFHRTDGDISAGAGATANIFHGGSGSEYSNPPANTLAESSALASNTDEFGAIGNALASAEATHSIAVGSDGSQPLADANAGQQLNAVGSDTGGAESESIVNGSSTGNYSLTLVGTPVNPRFHGHWLLLSNGSIESPQAATYTSTDESVEIDTAGGDWYVRAEAINGATPSWNVTWQLPDNPNTVFHETVSGYLYLPFDISWAYDGSTSVKVISNLDGSALAASAAGESSSVDWTQDAEAWLRIEDPNPPGISIIRGGTELSNPTLPVVPPKIADVTIGSTLTTSYANPPYDFGTVVGSATQLKTVPVGAANQISVKFTKAVDISAGDLHLVSLNKAASLPTLSMFTPPDATNGYTATWMYNTSTPLRAGEYMIWIPDSVHDFDGNALDGEWTNPGSISTTSPTTVFPSGDDRAGGDFKFVFTYLPGDMDLNNAVNFGDSAMFGAAITNPASVDPLVVRLADMNGNGAANFGDFTAFGNLVTSGMGNQQLITLVGDTDNDHELSAAEQIAFDNSPTDINGDGFADSTDVAAFDAIWDAVGSTTSNPLRLLY
jgi:hypothetical protein